MTDNGHQTILGIKESFRFRDENPSHLCSWTDLSGCLLVWTSIIPAAIAVFTLIVKVTSSLFRNRPQWMKPFVQELNKSSEVEDVRQRDFSAHSTVVLTALILTGITLQIGCLFYPAPNPSAMLPILAWIIALLFVVAERTNTTPIGLLTIVASLMVTQAHLLVRDRCMLSVGNIIPILLVITELGALVIMLNMPLRSPSLPNDQIGPSFSEPTHSLRTPEDNLTLWQFMTVSWMSPLISLGSARQLNSEDIWSLGFEFQHKSLHENFRMVEGSVIVRLLNANAIDLIIITFIGILDSLTDFAGPVILQQLLRAMEDVHAPRSDAIGFAILALLVSFVRAQSSVFNLWYSRRSYERSRGEMITMLYEKTLSRKIVGMPEEDMADQTNGDGIVSRQNSKFGLKGRFWGVIKQALAIASLSRNQTSKESKKPASMGKILNLMRNDVYEVAERFWQFDAIIRAPLELILSVILIWRLIGWPCLIGVLTVIIAQGINAIFTRVLLHWERKRRTATDVRLQKTSQFVEAIRHLRWYGWQNFWQDQIMHARQQELNLRVTTRFWSIMISFTNTFASGMFPVVAFYAYTALAGLPLRIDVAFPALQLFNMLEGSLRDIPDLITVLLNAKVAVGRIEDFMHEPNRDDSCFSSDSTEARLEIRNASFAWPSITHPVLQSISVAFPTGLTIIYGKVAAGKTALLQALLGELDTLNGRVIRSDDMIGYCAQTPWLQSMSIRDNILFSSPREDARYMQVLEACALLPDLESFKDGDLSNIGENGIGLSGGQRARVALARAVYSRAKILLLDDPLSALDHQTAESIVRRCLGGPLMEGRTVLLVTHRTELCRNWATQMVEVTDGRAHVLDEEARSNDLHKSQSSESSGTADQKESAPQNDAVPEKFIEDEHRAHGDVKLAVYWEYIKAGKLKWWAVLLCILALYRLISVGETWFLKQWGEAYNRPLEQTLLEALRNPFDKLPSPEVNVQPWLLGFFLIAAAQAFSVLISQSFMLVIIYSAGRQMFQDIIGRVSHATFRFYDVTPIGRLMNRLTSDVGTIDGNISQQFRGVAFSSISWISAIIIIASVTPVFLAFSFVLSATFVVIFLKFLPTSQSLRRLEMVSLSPMMSNFGTLLEGLTTVRAFCVQSRFQDRIIEVTDAFQKMDHFYWSLQAWLTYRFDILSASSTLILTLLAIYTGVSPGLTAFVLIAASQFVDSTHNLCRQYGRLQMDFVSVERIVELLHLEQESPGTTMPPASWPSYSGDIVFENVTIRYAPHLEPSLSNISFRVPAGSTTALLGRTGSGKSTLATSLLATILPETGRILIDNVDIAKVNLQALRSRVTFLAQDPVLFPGSLRHNLDPLGEHSDDACKAAVERVCSIYEWTLETQIDTGGRNLSQGQRQLVGLARAVLRRSAIIILDEATASIDMATAAQIQQVLREEMRESTVITIAHRLEAVVNADYFVRLENGRVAAQGPAATGMMHEVHDVDNGDLEEGA